MAPGQGSRAKPVANQACRSIAQTGKQKFLFVGCQDQRQTPLRPVPLRGLKAAGRLGIPVCLKNISAIWGRGAWTRVNAEPFYCRKNPCSTTPDMPDPFLVEVLKYLLPAGGKITREQTVP